MDKNIFLDTTACLLIMFSLLLMGADRGGQDEINALRNEQSALRTKIQALKNEQDYLLFLREMYRSDSKYLVINIAARTGQLKYKNRLLKEFKFRLAKNFHGGSQRAGVVVLTKKTEDKRNRRALEFGASFLIHGKGTAVPRTAGDVAVISVTGKDLLSIYYALEEGALAYLERPSRRSSPIASAAIR